jgi:transposase
MHTPHCEFPITAPTALFLAFELSNKNWKLGFTVGLGQKPRQRTIPARDFDQLLAEIGAAKRRFQLPEDVPVFSCYEAGRDGFYLHRFLDQAGVHNIVVDSSGIEVNRRARRAKTDRLDLGKLLTQLIRYHGGETKVWSVVHVPSVEAEDGRHPNREMGCLKKERTREVNRIKGLLASQGIALTVRGRARVDLDTVRLWDGSPLPPGIRGRIERAMARLDLVDEQIRALEQLRATEIRDSVAPEVAKMRSLMAFKGIGPATASVMVHELFGWRTFQNRRQVGAVAGLTPTPYQSGDSTRDQGISKAGNGAVRSTAVELAWRWVHFQPHSHLTRWFVERFGAGSSRQRRIGIVALARKLLIALWRFLETGEIPHGAILTI